MKLEHVSEKRLKSDVTYLLETYLDLSRYTVFVFGSRVTGKASERSDIDIGIEGDAPIDGATMARIREDLQDLPYLYKIQIIDFSQVSDRFYQVAKQVTEPLLWYE